MNWIINCPYCGHITTVGETKMMSGYVGCKRCYFVPNGLVEQILFYMKHDYESYKSGKFYEEGFYKMNVK